MLTRVRNIQGRRKGVKKKEDIWHQTLFLLLMLTKAEQQQEQQQLANQGGCT